MLTFGLVAQKTDFPDVAKDTVNWFWDELNIQKTE
jgi:hypothetical protein